MKISEGFDLDTYIRELIDTCARKMLRLDKMPSKIVFLIPLPFEVDK